MFVLALSTNTERTLAAPGPQHARGRYRVLKASQSISKTLIAMGVCVRVCGHYQTQALFPGLAHLHGCLDLAECWDKIENRKYKKKSHIPEQDRQLEREHIDI